MKKLLFLALFPTLLLASGHVSFTPAYHLPTGKLEPKLGVGVYEPLLFGVYYDGWVGGGFHPTAVETVPWLSTSHDLIIPISKEFEVSPGCTFRAARSDSKYLQDYLGDHEIHVKVTYKLW